MPRPLVHCFQHSERVRPLTVAEWAQERDVELRIVRVDEQPLPDPSEVRRLVVLGGQMNTDEVAQHPWLDAERTFLRELLTADRDAGAEARVLGICLGSQLLAEVLGGSVARAEVPEIGWQRVELTDAGRASHVFGSLGDTFDAFEWHGDAWQLPPDTQLMATSAGCVSQAFSYGEHVHGVQFHPEFTYARTRDLAASTTDDLSRGGHVQEADDFLADADRFGRLRETCMLLLDRALLEPVPA